MRFPYERFLRFLVSRKVDLDSRLVDYELPTAGNLWKIDALTDLLDDAPIAVKRYLEDDDRETVDLTAGFLEWADRHGIRELWETQPEFGGHRSETVDLSFQIFVNMHTRAAMGLLLLSSLDDGDVKASLKDQFDLDVDDACLFFYRRTFWDIDGMERRAWETFVGSLVTKEERNLIGAGLASPGKEEVRHMLGLGMPIEPETVLKSVMQKAYFHFTDMMTQADPEHAGAIKWAELAKSCATSLLGRGAKGDEAERLPANFAGMFSVKVTKTKHLSLTDIQGDVGAPPTKTSENGK